jgi:hypothetical protein
VARSEQPYEGDERSLLQQWLDFQRDTLALKCEGLSADDLARQPLAPSTLSLARLLRHLADMEHIDACILRGLPAASMYEGDDAGEAEDADEVQDGMFDWSLYDVDDDAVAVWRQARAELDAAARAYADVDATAPGDFAVLTLRSILLGLTMEYARHNGHADLLRQALDGRVGY